MLTDVFEKFISTCLKYYELDPCHYFSAPGLSWDAMLKMTGVKLEKISDIEQYIFIEKGSRGGTSYIASRYAKANNKYMCDYDSNKQSTFITYLDKNNLYGWAMSAYLPYSEFERLKSVDGLDVMPINKKSDLGYILEVELNILKSYMNYTMIIHLLMKNLLLLMICCRHIVKKLLINMR